MAEETPKTQSPSKSPSEMLSSAKAKVTGAARDVIDATKGYGKPDGDSGVGHYVGKAEDYLHKLHSPSDQPAALAEVAEKKAKPAPAAPPAEVVAEKKVEPAHVAPPAEVVAEKKAEPAPVAPPAEVAEKKAESAPPTEGGGEKKDETAAAGGGEGGIGGLMNKAKGLFK